MVSSRRVLIAFAMALACGTMTHAQEKPEPPRQLPPVPESPIPEVTQVSAVAPCLQPPPVVRWQDYEGKFQKVVGVFGRKLELTTVTTIRPTHYKQGTVFCTLTLGGKFLLLAEDSIEPATFLGAAFNAGIDQAQNTTPAYGQGAAGYAKRFASEYVGQASAEFFKIVVYSEIFREDPRYYRLAYGGAKRRFFHALAHAVVTHRENGGYGFNFSEWLGTTSAQLLSYTYRPGADTSVGHTAGQVVSSIAQDAGWDVLREFWPEIAHKFKLPFRDEPRPRTPIFAPAAPPGSF